MPINRHDRRSSDELRQQHQQHHAGREVWAAINGKQAVVLWAQHKPVKHKRQDQRCDEDSADGCCKRSVQSVLQQMPNRIL
jgi:hypothetical protein